MKNNKSCLKIDEIGFKDLTFLREKGININIIESFIGCLSDEDKSALEAGIVQATYPTKSDFINQYTKGCESCMPECIKATIGQNFQELMKGEDPEFKEKLYRFLKSKDINVEEFSQHVLDLMAQA